MINEYINYLSTIMGYSSNTLEAYHHDLTSFASWAKENIEDARWSTIQRSDIERYIEACSLQGFTPATTNRKLSALRSIYRFWIRQGRIGVNPAKGVYTKSAAHQMPTTIDENDIMTAYHNSDGAMRLAIGLMYTTGVRLSELLSIRYTDVNMSDGSIRIQGKGNHERMVYVPQGIINLIAEQHEADGNEPTLIPYKSRTFRRKLEDIFHASGIYKPCNPHAFRHTAATNWAASGASNTTIAKALGHTRLETSKKYIDVAQVGVKTMMIDNNMFH